MIEKVIKKPIIKKGETAVKKVVKASPKAEKKTVAAKDVKEKKTATKVATTEKKATAIKTLSKDSSTKKNDDIKVEEISEKKVKIIRAKVEKSKTDSLNRTYATGKRKNAVAKVWLKKGSGKITINNKEPKDYLKRSILEVIINVPFNKTGTQDKYDVVCYVLGGGLSGQAGAIKQGIAKALNLLNAEAYRKDLKSAGLLTRDSRVVERKKPGLKKARKGQVFSKR